MGRFIHRLHSLRNTVLIHTQMPGATKVAGFNAWKKNFDRHVRKGEKGIRILAPDPIVIKEDKQKLDPDTGVPLFDKDGKPMTDQVEKVIPQFKPVSVFDLSQTEGEPLRDLAEDIAGDVGHFDTFMEALGDVSPFAITIEPLPDNTDGMCRYADRTISVREGMSQAQTVSAAIHEVAHALLHDYNRKLGAQEQEQAGTTESPDAPVIKNRRAKEVEAESVSYVVCQHYGIETGDNSFGYIASWSKDQSLPELQASLEIIRSTAAGLIDRLDERYTELCQEQGVDIAATEQKPIDVSQNEVKQEVSAATETQSPASMTLAEKKIKFVQQHENLPLQDRLNIIAETFGCKTARIRTSPCTGKWRGTSDICLDLDNGSSLGIGNDRTPKAKSAKAINECVNSTLANYNPVILHEAKERAAVFLAQREAADNTIAAEKGLKPYTFLNVELNDGSDKSTQSHLGWYYVTLAVDDKIFGLVETGLNYDIASGVLSESRPDYFVAGAVKESEVDFVFNNVGHSTESSLYKIHLSDDARQRAEKTLAEKVGAEIEEMLDEPPAPDPSIAASERDLYGYKDDNMLPLTQEKAFELFEQDLTVYLLHDDGTETMVFDHEDIEAHSGLFGIDAQDWAEHLAQPMETARVDQRETPPLESGDTFQLFQLKDDPELRNYRFVSLGLLEADGLALDKDNYRMVYEAPLSAEDSLDSIYERFNLDHPSDFTGHSLSVSDVIVLNRGGETTAHYVDSYGFAEVPGFLESPAPEMPSLPEQKPPTVAELEEKVSAGEQISLMDLSNAMKREQKANKKDERGDVKPVVSRQLSDMVGVRRDEKKPSILEQLRQPAPQDAKQYPAAQGRNHEPVYKQSFAVAHENGEIDLFHQSNRRNLECCVAIDSAIAESRYDTNHYDVKTAAKKVVDEFGADRVSWVMAGVLQRSDHDGRYSSDNKAWASAFAMPEETRRVYLQSHPAIVDGFIHKARQMLAKLDRGKVAKPSILAQLHDDKKTAAKATKAAEKTLKRGAEREVL